MSALSEQLALLADRVALAEQWLDHANVGAAREALAGVHAELVALAEETNR